jgi:hypothetical protein
MANVRNKLFRNIGVRPNTFLEQAQQSASLPLPQVQKTHITTTGTGGQVIRKGGKEFQLDKGELKTWADIQRGGGKIPKGQEEFYSEKLRELASMPEPEEQEALNRQEQFERLAARGRLQASGAQAQEQPIDWRQVGLSTVTDPRLYKNILSGVQSGAITGGLLGGGVGAGAGGVGALPGAGIGAGIGAVGGTGIAIYSSIMENIKDQKTDNVAAMERTLTDGRTNLNQIAQLIQMDPDNALEYLELYNEQLINIAESEKTLRREVSTDLNLALSLDGTRQLNRFENFYARGGALDISNAKLNRALTMAAVSGGSMPQMMQDPSMMGAPIDEERALMMSETEL